jgi:hypothetical protein
MLTQEKVLESFESGTIDGRDASRLADFFPVSDWAKLGCGLKEGAATPPVRPWTEDEIKKQLAEDVSFGFEKALDQRGLSAGLMYAVVKMWLWILEDSLAEMDSYAQYGLPLFKAVAVKYGFDNPIGEDAGDEYKYSADYGCYD